MKHKLTAISISANAILVAIVAYLISSGDGKGDSALARPNEEGLVRKEIVRKEIDWADHKDPNASVGKAANQLVIAPQTVPALKDTGAFEYWLPSYVTTARMRLAEHRLRSSGAATTREPSLSVKLRYPFLSDSKLAQVEAIFLEADERRVGAVDGNLSIAILQLEQRIAEDVDRAVVALLTPSELLEYRMRDSALAQQLLATGFIFTEQEFRTIFSKLAQQDSTADHGRIASTGRRIQLGGSVLSKVISEELTADRAEEFLRIQDPAYRALMQVTASMSLGADKVQSAYEAIRKSRDELHRNGLMFGPMNRKQADKVGEINAARDQVLKKILGDVGAKKLVAVLNTLNARGSISATV